MTQQVRNLLIILLIVLLTGTVGFHFLEGWSVLDSLYMTIITLTTIGFGEVRALDEVGKVFTIFLIIFGIATAGYAVRMLGELILDGQLKSYFGRKAMEKNIKKLKDHYIVCGFGRVGQVVCEELHRNKIPFAVIEFEESRVEELEKAGYVYVRGSASDDENLQAAGIEKATGMINTVANEADAVYVTISAKQQNPNLFILARADSSGAETKLHRAGASKVISPHVTAGVRMAQAALRPAVVDFMTVASNGKNEGLKIEEIAVKQGSKLAGKSLVQSGIRSELGITVIGAKKQGVEMYYNPPADFFIDEGDTLIVVGHSSQLEKLETFCKSEVKA